MRMCCSTNVQTKYLAIIVAEKRGIMDSFEVARLAGVSRSTVSKVVNGHTDVSKETRKKVLEIIEQYGYIPNSAARSLVGASNKVVGLFVLNYLGMGENIIHSSPFITEFLTYAADYLQEKDYKLMISIINKEERLRDIEDMFASMQVIGGIVMGDILPQSIIKNISKKNYNTILVSQYDSVEYDNVLLINTENFAAGYQVVQALLGKGHRRILHISGPKEKSSTGGRYRGYCQCMDDYGLAKEKRVVFVENIHSEVEGYVATKEYFSNLSGDIPTAIFTCNDICAIGCMRALQSLGYVVPRDISVIGHDDSEVGRHISPSLSTVVTSMDILAKKTVELLIGKIENNQEAIKESPYIIEEFEVVLRQSVRDIANESMD